jgi:hypothetical protein
LKFLQGSGRLGNGILGGVGLLSEHRALTVCEIDFGLLSSNLGYPWCEVLLLSFNLTLEGNGFICMSESTSANRKVCDYVVNELCSPSWIVSNSFSSFARSASSTSTSFLRFWAWAPKVSIVASTSFFRWESYEKYIS